MSKRKNKGGRRGKFHNWISEQGLLKLEGWARDGLTDEQIAQNIGIVPSTLYAWQNRFPEISEALKRGKEVVDRQVENALLKRALGYTYDEVTHEPVYNKDTEEVELQPVKVVTKEVQPDTTAQIFWLKNRKPQEWRDKQEIEHSGGLDNTNTELTPEERKQRIAELKAKLK